VEALASIHFLRFTGDKLRHILANLAIAEELVHIPASIAHHQQAMLVQAAMQELSSMAVNV